MFCMFLKVKTYVFIAIFRNLWKARLIYNNYILKKRKNLHFEFRRFSYGRGLGGDYVLI